MKDIDILNIDKSTSKADMTLTGDKVSGIRMLAQRILVVLLTDMQGLLRSSEGSEAFGVLTSYTGNATYASLLLTSSISTVSSVLMSDTQGPSEERLQSIVVQDVSTNDGSINFTLLITNAAGESEIISSNIGAIE